MIAEDPKSVELIKPFLVGKDIKRYAPLQIGKYLILIAKGWTRGKALNNKISLAVLEQNYPAIARHLKPFEAQGQKRYDKGEYWWELRTCDYYSEFEKPKILWPEIAGSARFTLDNGALFANNKVFLIPEGSLYLLGLLNSSLLRLFIHSVCTDLQGDSFNFSGVFIAKTPIRPINFSDPADKNRHDKMVSLVEQILALNKQLASAKTAHEKTILQRQIDATDQQIDNLVYELYGLTEEEIKIVEST